MKFGCLQILDEGSEYPYVVHEKIAKILDEREQFIADVNAGKYECAFVILNKTSEEYAYKYIPKNFEIYWEGVAFSDFDKAINVISETIKIKHYKCKCKKCGKIRYYSEETLIKEPKVCYKPVYCTRTSYQKLDKYKNDESVHLFDKKYEIKPDDVYCSSWNEKRRKELIKQAKIYDQIIAALPRKKALNYDIDYVGSTYESLDVLECVNDALESVNVSHSRHKKVYNDVTVYKEYRCKCYLCGKEMTVTCDKFGIYPPTEYGYRAYGGYWSNIYCDCHKISSFQWIVTDILIKHSIDYKVEVKADGVYGIDDETPLRFDFAIYKDGIIKAYIECQGEQHYMSVDEFGGERRFAIQQRNDEKKRKYAKEKGIELIEISYKNKKYGVVESILKEKGII